jgi:RNA polymerase primary sigma factor
MGNLETYLEAIGQFELLTPEQERKLVNEAQEGNIDSRNALIEANLRLVVHIAKRFVGFGLDMDDLVEEGNLGLFHAIDGFKPEFNTRFTTYAGPWIRQSIGRALHGESETTRKPEWVQTLVRKYNNAVRILQEPSFDEACDYLNLPEKTRRCLKTALERHVAVQEDAGEGDEKSFIEDRHLSPDEETAAQDEASHLHTQVDALPSDERAAITSYYFEGHTYDQVAEELHCCRARVQNLCKKALKSLSLQLA